MVIILSNGYVSVIFFAMHQIPLVCRTHLATIQFYGMANAWYDGFLMDNEPLDWNLLRTLVHKRFIRPNSKTALEEWMVMQQTGTVTDYLDQFEKLRSKLLLEGRNFSTLDYVDAFVGRLKGEIRPFVKLFKPNTLEDAFESALHVENAVEFQLKKLKGGTKLPFSPAPLATKSVDRVPFSSNKTFPNTPGKSLIEQRRALGQCFKCGDKYFPGHQCKVKVQMLIGEEEEQQIEVPPAQSPEVNSEEVSLVLEEAIISMHTTTNNPKVSTMQFKGFIGHTPVTTLIDSGSTHSFINLIVLKGQICQVADTHPLVVMVANGNQMVIDSKCESLCFSIQGNEFVGDMRLLPVQGYDVILGLDLLSQWGEMCINWHDKWLKFKKGDQDVHLSVVDEVEVIKMCEELNLQKEMQASSEMLLVQVWLCEVNAVQSSSTPVKNVEIQRVFTKFASMTVLWTYLLRD
jgi:Retroviral aspartyl protease/Retrotransposon gag protein